MSRTAGLTRDVGSGSQPALEAIKDAGIGLLSMDSRRIMIQRVRCRSPKCTRSQRTYRSPSSDGMLNPQPCETKCVTSG